MVTLSLNFFLKKIRSQFKETVISVQIALTVLTGYFLTAERNYSFRLYITDFLSKFCPECYLMCRPKLPVNMHGPFVMLAR